MRRSEVTLESIRPTVMKMAPVAETTRGLYFRTKIPARSENSNMPALAIDPVAAAAALL
eukprot:CAMPEP_0181339366 /NCGR_PEP_ID=MMETSP1101-20121128/29214_1 /TAXON_ID=46948 /ORGANISM="Rhodomonas abbreviata, Strain Caron Lab Isolate" /LENGTH=58 /DNA_ID=CAMNT_0023450323 /DNA_START=97 /DNA_END=269 /DNA_ORIENTATION=+